MVFLNFTAKILDIKRAALSYSLINVSVFGNNKLSRGNHKIIIIPRPAEESSWPNTEIVSFLAVDRDQEVMSPPS